MNDIKTIVILLQLAMICFLAGVIWVKTEAKKK